MFNVKFKLYRLDCGGLEMVQFELCALEAIRGRSCRDWSSIRMMDLEKKYSISCMFMITADVCLKSHF